MQFQNNFKTPLIFEDVQNDAKVTILPGETGTIDFIDMKIWLDGFCIRESNKEKIINSHNYNSVYKNDRFILSERLFGEATKLENRCRFWPAGVLGMEVHNLLSHPIIIDTDRVHTLLPANRTMIFSTQNLSITMPDGVKTIPKVLVNWTEMFIY